MKSNEFMFFSLDSLSYISHRSCINFFTLSTNCCILVSPLDNTSLSTSFLSFDLSYRSHAHTSFVSHFSHLVLLSHFLSYSATALSTISNIVCVNGLFSKVSSSLGDISIFSHFVNSLNLSILSCSLCLISFSSLGLNILFTISFALSCILWITSKILAIVVLVSFAHCGSFTFAVHSTVFGASVVASSTITSGVEISSPHSLNHSTVSP